MLHAHGRVFDHIVQNRGADAFDIELEIRNDAGNSNRVGNIRLT